MAKRMRGLYKRGKMWWCTYKDLYGRIVRQSTGKSEYDDAASFLVAQRAKVDEGGEPEKKKRYSQTFSELAEAYLKWCERQKSFRGKAGHIRQLIAAFKNIQLRYINTRLVEEYQTERIKKGNKPATVNRHIAALKHMIHKGYEWEMLPEEVLKKVRRVKLLKENNRRLRYLSASECQLLLSNCNGHVRDIVTVALNTGMRKGEILKLRWDNVDLRHGLILLDRTKNGDRREIPINEAVRNVFLKITRRIDSPYVFIDPNTGKPFRDIKKGFAAALRRSGIVDFRFHDLRHTFASHLIMAGVDITTVKELLGHRTLTMTLRYAHLAPAHKVKALDMLNETLNGNSTSHFTSHSAKTEFFRGIGEHS